MGHSHTHNKTQTDASPNELAVSEKLTKYVKDQTGQTLELCNYFTGVNVTFGGKFYINADPMTIRGIKAHEYALDKLIGAGVIESYEPNGASRQAVFINLKALEEIK